MFALCLTYAHCTVYLITISHQTYIMHKFRVVCTLLACALGASSSLAFAQAADSAVPASPGAELHQTPARQGWFWYLDPKKEEKKEEEPVQAPPPKVEAPKDKGPVIAIARPAPDDEKRCQDKASWDAKCGFIDPGNDFEFQAKQRDILLQQMSLTPDNPDAVEAAQRYMKWVVAKASMAANMWYFNMVQNPDLDPTVKNPISEVGIALATRINQASQVEYFNLIREEGGVLFFFSRQDCIYCHQQAPYTQRVARTMGLKLINVPLDGKCLEGFEGDNCGDNIKPEQVAVLNVQVVPALYLYVPSSTWIRLGTGLVTDTTVLANTVNFFSAYRAAMLNGLDNGKGARPSVTFDPKFAAKGTGTAPADGSTAVAAPDRQRMLELMGYSKPK